MKKDTIESILATIIILAYVYLVIVGKAQIEGFAVISLYVIKKYLDGIEEERNNNKGEKE